MRISISVQRCESDGVNPARHYGRSAAVPAAALAFFEGQSYSPAACIFGPAAAGTAALRLRVRIIPLLRCGLAVWLLGTASLAVTAEETNSPAITTSTPSRAESAPQKLDEAAFRIIAERNIFNAERIGAVRIASSRRPARVESFKLVGTMAYAKGAFAFFEGSSSELTKVVPADGVIAGHKLVDILTDGVKLEADGKILEVSIGSAMRREDEGTWRLGEAVAGSASSSPVSSRDNGDANRSSRSRRGESDSERGNGSESNRSATTSAASTADPAEILKRLMERREKESQ